MPIYMKKWFATCTCYARHCHETASNTPPSSQFRPWLAHFPQAVSFSGSPQTTFCSDDKWFHSTLTSVLIKCEKTSVKTPP